MKSKLGIILICIGAVLVSMSLILLIRNDSQEKQAQQQVEQVMTQLTDIIMENMTEPKPAEEITKVQIDGQEYIGVLSIPNLQLELPIMADWDNKKLKIAPCRYSGSIAEDNLVIMAHNYKNHFESISDLRTGDSVIFTNLEGKAECYEVVALDILDSTDVAEMVAGEYDLTLFTCSYDGKSRVTVRCDHSRENVLK